MASTRDSSLHNTDRPLSNIDDPSQINARGVPAGNNTQTDNKSPRNYLSQSDSRWKDDFYDLFFHEMENQYHVGKNVGGMTSTAKTRASMVNTMFSRTPIGFNERIGSRSSDYNISNPGETPGNFISEIELQDGKAVGDITAPSDDDRLKVRTGIHILQDSDTGKDFSDSRYVSLINYNKHRFILGPRTASFTVPESNSTSTDSNSFETEPRDVNKLVKPEWLGDFERENLFNHNPPGTSEQSNGGAGTDVSVLDANTEEGSLTRRRWQSWLASTRTNRFRNFKTYQRQDPDTFGRTTAAEAALTQPQQNNDETNGTGDKNAQSPPPEDLLKRTVAYEETREAKHRWNSYGFSDVYLTRRELADIYDVSTRSIINHFSPIGGIGSNNPREVPMNNMMLRPADFAYLRQMGHYSNNRLVILRRYAKPVGNDPTLNPDNMPIATLVTWLDPSTDISFGGLEENWVNENDDIIDFFQQFLGLGKESSAIGNKFGELLGLASKGIKKTGGAALGAAVQMASGAIKKGKLMDLATIQILKGLGFSAGANVRGNVKANPNLVTQTMRRSADGEGKEKSGVSGSFSFNFETEYEFKFFAGHDPEQAMLDTIANALTMFTSDRESLLQPQSMSAWNSVNNVMQNDSGSILNFVKTMTESINSGQAFQNLLDSTLTSFNNYGAFLYSSYETKLKAALAASSGEPNGVWHLTIGNPKKPLVSIGNLVLSSGNIKLDTKEMTFQDFPSRIKLSCQLKNAQPLGRQDVENALSAGFGRIYNDVSEISDQTWNSIGNPLEKLSQVDKDLAKDVSLTDPVTTNDELKNGTKTVSTESIGNAAGTTNAAQQQND